MCVVVVFVVIVLSEIVAAVVTSVLCIYSVIIFVW